MQLVTTTSLESVAYGFIPPVSTANLVLWSFVGGTAAKSIKNWAPGGVDSSVQGNPAYASAYATLLPGSNYLISNALEGDDETLVAIARVPTEASSFIMSNYTGATVLGTPATTRGTGLTLESGSAGDSKMAAVYHHAVKDGSNTDVLADTIKDPCVTVNAFEMVVGRNVASTKTRTIKSMTSGLSNTAVASFATDLSAAKILIGSAYTPGTFLNPIDVAFAAVFQRALSDAELATLYAWAKSYYSSRGLTI